MAEFVEVMAIRNRMCNKVKGCGNCPISSSSTGFTCRELVHRDPKKYEDILLKWNAEHPIKTNKDKFEEVFGFNMGLDMMGCNGFDCPDNQVCETCQFLDFWKKEYKEKTDGRND